MEELENGWGMGAGTRRDRKRTPPGGGKDVFSTVGLKEWLMRDMVVVPGLLPNIYLGYSFWRGEEEPSEILSSLPARPRMGALLYGDSLERPCWSHCYPSHDQF